MCKDDDFFIQLYFLFDIRKLVLYTYLLHVMEGECIVKFCLK